MIKQTKAESIIKNMSLSEKIGQMTQLPPYIYIHNSEAVVYGTMRNLQLNETQIYTAGSVLGIGSPKEMIELQKKYLDNATHQIPLLFMADIIHGYKTIFPVPIALASSFNPDIARLVARISALEAYTSGIHIVFSPMCDLTRDPRWGRVVEGFGEDVLLTSSMSEAMVEGYTNFQKFGEGSVACCIKHFAGYGACEAGRDYNTVDISRLSLYRDYLPAYKKALDAGADMIMTSFNTLDGVPATINKFLLRDVLRELWLCKAITIADYDALNQVIEHGAAFDQMDAAYKGFKAGLDIEMASSVYMNMLEKHVNNGNIEESALDEVVKRIIDLKIKLGLFDNPYSGANIEKEKQICLSEEHLEASKKAALESVVMLENKQLLPLKGTEKIALIGPYANNRSLIGPWSWMGKDDIHLTLSEVFDKHLVFVSKKSVLSDYTKEEIEEIRSADVVILAIGEDASLSGEAHSRSDISLPNKQEDLYSFARSISKKLVTLIFAGRPLLLNKLSDSDALLYCWFLGSQSSEAIYDLCFGFANPSGKLPMSFPRNVGQIPIYYNHFNTGRPFNKASKNVYLSKYLDVKNEPLYPFGFGLSYCVFHYEDLKLSSYSITSKEKLDISVKITNKNNYRGFEVVQVYIRDYVAEIVRPIKELKKFKKVWFEGFESKVVDFELNIDDLSYLDDSGNSRCENGKFSVMVGTSSIDVLSEDFYFLIN